MQRKKNRSYPGVLGKSVSSVSVGDHQPTHYASMEEAHASYAAYDEGMLLLLLDHFKIPRDDSNRWRALALELAKRHVPLFGERLPRGRPAKWNSERDAVAKICIDRFIEDHPAHRIKSAAAIVAKQAHWKKFLSPAKNPGEQIRQAYFRASPDSVKWVLFIADKLESLPPGTTGMYAILVSNARRVVLSEGEILELLETGSIGQLRPS